MIVDAGAIVAGRLDRQGIDNDNNLKPTMHLRSNCSH